MKQLLVAIALSLGVCVSVCAGASTDDDPVRASVVLIRATHRHPELNKPWLSPRTHDVSGTGFIIDGNKILTSAHVVEYATKLVVQAGPGGPKSNAKVLMMAPDIDLAILQVEDELFFKDRTPLVLEPTLAQIKQEVTVYGYPSGGTGLSVTKGIVSRVDHAPYIATVGRNNWALRVQIDAAINPGNSGGPALVDGRVVGLVFGRLVEAEGSGLLVPVEEINLFLKDIDDGQYDGKPVVEDQFQNIANPELRRRLGIADDVTGLMVRKPASGAEDYPLKTWDVVTHVNGMPIGNDGTIKVREGLDVIFLYAFQSARQGDVVPISIIRKGKKLEVRWTPLPHSRLLVPPLDGRHPSYFLCGPMVFTALTEDYLALFDEALPGWASLFTANGSPIPDRRHGLSAEPGEQLVVLSCQMFQHPTREGYTDATLSTVKSVNGITIKNLAHMAQVIHDSTEQDLVIEFVDHAAQIMVFDRKAVLAATDEIMDQNGIRRPCSDDLSKIWTLP